jgi:threonine aldolase
VRRSRVFLQWLQAPAVDALILKRSDIHYPRAKVVSLTQSTEFGTVYSIAEIKAISAIARAHGLKVHMDGARFANAIATLNVRPAEVTWQAGVDVLCFGGTKNGLPVGEAVIFFDTALATDFAYRVDQAGQLASKMRFISAPWFGLLENDIWLRNAQHANLMASKLYDEMSGIPNLRILHPPQANAVFVELPPGVAEALHDRGWHFYDFVGAGSRFMCSWETRPETIDKFVAVLRQLCMSGRDFSFTLQE